MVVTHCREKGLVFSVANTLRLARYRAAVKQINAIEPTLTECPADALRAKTNDFRTQLRKGASLDTLLPEAFAVVREACRRTVGLRPYDVQLVGGMAIHDGCIAEMQTGEGKTLVATMPAYLNALPGQGVHVVTVNDYLAQRDTEWMGPVYEFLGLRLACILHGMTSEQKRDAYNAHITYGTNKEFAFDYLRDRLAATALERQAGKGLFERYHSAAGSGMQRPHHCAIVDEIDSILIDEARVPLIISEAPEGESPYADVIRYGDAVAGALRRDAHFVLDGPKKDVYLTDDGRHAVHENALKAPDEVPPHRPFQLIVEQALRARHFYARDREYMVADDKIVIIDEFTGRKQPDRSWSIGLHQAVEAKEGVSVTGENRTRAQVTYQRYFKLYKKLSGMTGTARTSRREFWKVFRLPVVAIPTHRPMRRRMLPDRVYAGRRARDEAIAKRVEDLHKIESRPVLIGTRTVRQSERLSKLFFDKGVDHVVLNARQDADEAAVIARAGRPGAVTIATNMAGRGVDIVLGPGVDDIGGLHVIGTERHDARRIDLQLGGRCGRQGDPGSFEFFLSCEDDILRNWKRGLSVRLRRNFATWEVRLIPRWLLKTLFVLAQRAAERRHLNTRMMLMEYDEWLDKSKKDLGVATWG